ncbi:MAG TPA: 3-dehydroquinate synthase [Flavobacteriales bacterium]|nr:3-dehydroquinate synthase [Flavobacteriales bacterium]
MGATPQEVTEIDAGGHKVVMGRHALRALDRELSVLHPTALFVLGDENTLRHCLPELLAQVPRLREAQTLSVEGGEKAKDISVCSDIWRHLAEEAADRQALLICLGGGVVTDLGGFVAGTYKRGIRCVHVPTSLLGMVDAAIGGKSGVDLAGLKNMVGVFHDPIGTYVHVPFLKSLGKRDLLNGLAEMIKHGLVSDAEHWEAIGAAALHDLDALRPLIERSAAIKAAVVKADPREAGLRKVLNFGHTIGHGIEALSWESPRRALLHGEAVVIGMICEAWLSWRMDLLDRGSYDRITTHLMELYKPYTFDSSENHRMIELMRNDKKNAGGQFRFTLLTGIGSAKVDVHITAAQVQEALEHYRLLVKDVISK